MSRVRIVLANNSLAGYPQGGGHWTCFLQYLFGLNALGHDVVWLELLRSCGNAARDQRLINIFFGRFMRHGFKDRCALLLYGKHVTEPTLEAAHAYGMSKQRIREIARGCGSIVELRLQFTAATPVPFQTARPDRWGPWTPTGICPNVGHGNSRPSRVFERRNEAP